MIGKWRSYEIEGWAINFVLKEKLKKLESDLKNWSSEAFGSLDNMINNRRKEIQKLDALIKLFGLEEAEIMQRNEEMAHLLCDLKLKDSILRRKMRIKWLKVRDANTSLYHKFINKRRKRNDILRIQFENGCCEEVS